MTTSVLGQFANGPIQFNSVTGSIESRGTVDTPSPSATGNGTTASVMSQPDTVVGASSSGGGTVAGNSSSNSASGTTGLPAVGGGTVTNNPNEDWNGQDFTGNTGWDTNINGGVGTTVLPAMMAYDDGGAVDNDNDSDGTDGQGAVSATLDPMSFVKQAAAYGRTKMGLPSNFTTGETNQAMGFDDGGMIPDDTETGSSPQQAAVDPRSTMRYLTGDGAVSPEIANALEQHVDPNGQMDPAERTMAVLQTAPNDEARFGMMQHYRTLYNGFSAGAKASLDRGNLGQAAIHATQAFDAIPTGYKVHFAPARGGIAISARKLGGRSKGYANGGPVDENGALVQQSAPDSRGVMDDYYEGDYTRNGIGNGNIPDVSARIARAMPDGVMENVVNQVNQSEPSTNIEDRRNEPAWRSAVRNVTGYDDGGPVDEGSPDEGVLPPEQPEQPEQPTGEQNQTQVLTPEQFKALLSTGYDKPIDDGLPSMMSNFLGPVTDQQGRAYDWSKAPMVGGASGTTPASGIPSNAAPGSAYAAAIQNSQPAQQQQQSAASNDDGKTQRQSRYDEELERAEKLASKLYPWVSQEDKRSAFVANRMEAFQKDVGAPLETGFGRGGGGQARIEVARINAQKEADKQNSISGRQLTGIQSREGLARAQQAFQALDHNQRERVQLLAKQIAATPTADPETIQQAIQSHSKFLGLDQNTTGNMVQWLLSGQQHGNQQGGASRGPAQTQQPSQGQPTVVVYPSGPYAGQKLYRMPDGSLRKNLPGS